MSQNTKTEKRVLRFQHESVQKSFEDAAGRTGTSRDQRNLKGSQRRTRQEELARHHGKNYVPHGDGLRSSQAQRMTRRWLGVWLSIFMATSTCTPAIAACSPLRKSVQGITHEGRTLCGARCQGDTLGSEEVQDQTQVDSKQLHTPSSCTSGSWEPSTTRDLVSRVSYEVDGRSPCDEQDPGKDSSHPSQLQALHLPERCEGSQRAQQAETQRKALPEEPQGKAEDPHRQKSANLHAQEQQHTGRNGGEDADDEDGARSSLMPMRQPSNPADREEGRAHSRKTLLGVHTEGVQLLRMG